MIREGIWSLTLMVLLAGCGTDATAPDGSSPARDANRSPGVVDVQEAGDLGSFASLEPGTYSIDPDLDASTPLRVVYQVADEGWSQWIGAVKFAGDKHVGVSITTVSNLVRHGCHDHSRPHPRVGPTADDLADALAHLEPFRVTAPPTDITIYGYRGKHLELTVPSIDLGTCIDGKLKSWVDPLSEPNRGDAYYGYTGPGYVEEFWILDVDGSRLMIAAEHSPGSSAQDIAEMRAILASIQIEP